MSQLPTWVTHTRHSVWHAPISGGGSLATACGRHVYGPVHARRAEHPPADGRTMCETCALAIGLYTRPTELRADLAAALQLAARAPRIDETGPITWPADHPMPAMVAA
ncbi:hypothetical protein [Parasphingorhabdus pacifica]